MSMLAPNQYAVYKSVRVKVIRKSQTTPRSWYNNYVGQIFEANKKTWYEDGKVTHVSYEVPKTPSGGFNGHLSSDDIEVVS